MTDFFNTNNECGTELMSSREKAQIQQNLILSYFQTFHGKTFTPEEVWRAVFRDNTPLTSVRRAITNLTKDGKLFKTEHMKMGSFGKKSHTWRSGICS